MTPPDANIEKQTRRHRPALYGMAFVVIFGFLTLLLRVFFATDPDTVPVEDPTLRAPLEEGEAVDENDLPPVPDTQ